MTITAPRRTIGALAAGVALALAGCGADPASDAGGGAGAGASAAEGALAFARCMREQGIDFPDPRVGEGGEVSVEIGGEGGIDPASPKFQAAQKKCGSPLGAAGPGE